MFKNFIKILLLLIIICGPASFAQKVKEEKDSAAFYRNIQHYSKKRKFTKFVHRLIFNPLDAQKKKTKPFLENVLMPKERLFEKSIL